MGSNLFNLYNFPLVGNDIVSEEDSTDKEKTEEAFFTIENCDGIFERIQGILIHEDLELDISNPLNEMHKCKTLLKTVNILGEYFPEKQHIEYYKQTPENLKITQIHERFHAVHHLTRDNNGAIWDEFQSIRPFYKELLAQLFTWIYISNYESSLYAAFTNLNDTQPFIYQTYKIFRHYDMQEAEKLYWDIRNNTIPDRVSKVLETIAEKIEIISLELEIENAVSKGIRTTINRFREHPFLYFTEADIHASLKADIINGNSDIFYKFLKPDKQQIQVSLVHLEYPTNFKFSRESYAGRNNDENISNETRGNFDLIILKPEFLSKVSNNNHDTIMIIIRDFRKKFRL